MLKKKEKISIICPLTLRYDKLSLARTTPVWNIFHGSKGVRAIEGLLYIHMHKLSYLSFMFFLLFLYPAIALVRIVFGIFECEMRIWP